jgi:hypothetical protein
MTLHYTNAKQDLGAQIFKQDLVSDAVAFVFLLMSYFRNKLLCCCHLTLRCNSQTVIYI